MLILKSLELMNSQGNQFVVVVVEKSSSVEIKKNIKVIDEKLSSMIVKFVYSDFSISNSAHPTAICTTCRLALTAIEKVIFFL